VVLAVFKAVVSLLRGARGGFDSHTLPPRLINLQIANTKRVTFFSPDYV